MKQHREEARQNVMLLFHWQKNASLFFWFLDTRNTLFLLLLVLEKNFL